MCKTLERILTAAERAYGPERLSEIRPLLDQVADDLRQLDAFPLDSRAASPPDSPAEHPPNSK